MIYRIVISHNQSQYIERFPTPSVLVFDSISADDIDICNHHRIPYTTVSSKGNRSWNRNTGLQYVIDYYHPADTDIIEFFDGDRYPIIYNEKFIEHIMQDSHLDALLYTCQTDARCNRMTVPEHGAIVVDTGVLCNPFYSCGFAMKYSSIKCIQQLNDGYFFNKNFIYWGCEDQYIGIECDSLNMKVGLTKEIQLNGSVGGDSEIHIDYRESLQQYIDTMVIRGFPLRNVPRQPQLIQV